MRFISRTKWTMCDIRRYVTNHHTFHTTLQPDHHRFRHLHSQEEISFIHCISHYETVDPCGSVHLHAKIDPTIIDFRHLHSQEEISFIHRIPHHETVDQCGSVHLHSKIDPTTIEFRQIHNKEEISLSPRNLPISWFSTPPINASIPLNSFYRTGIINLTVAILPEPIVQASLRSSSV